MSECSTTVYYALLWEIGQLHEQGKISDEILDLAKRNASCSRDLEKLQQIDKSNTDILMKKFIGKGMLAELLTDPNKEVRRIAEEYQARKEALKRSLKF